MHNTAAKNTQNHEQAPPISFIMPVLNEAAYLRDAVLAIVDQHYPGSYEIILALAPSSDGTDQIAAELAAQNLQIKIVHNPALDISAGLNAALKVAEHELVVRVDAHSELSADYALTAATILSTTGAVNVGGTMRAAGRTPKQQAIADCYNSPAGLGGGVYHAAAPAGAAESAYLGVFKKSAVLAAGGFAEDIRRGEDWELNFRLRQAGELVWFDPRLSVIYRPRDTYRALAKQFYATGVWRAIIMRKHKLLKPLRYFVPGILVLALALSLCALLTFAVLSFSNTINPVLWLLAAAAPALYLTGTAAVSVGIGAKRSWFLRFLALLVMHTCWGTGFLRGIVFGAKGVYDRSRVRAAS